MGEMGIFRWIIEHWTELLNAIGVFGGLFGLYFTAYSIREETKARKVANLIAITSNHRDLWKESLGRPDLSRINDPKANPGKKPVTQEELAFANFVILHLNSAYYAMKDEMVIKLQGLRRDAHSFLSNPVPRAVWEKTKKFQNADFVEFVEECIRGGQIL
jgi:hypothetical protein